LTNLLMHLLCVVLVFLLVQTLIGSEAWPFALFAAVWFALSPHPNTAEIWINGRSDLFCTAYGLAAILVWHRALVVSRQPSRIGLHLLAGLLFLFGLLSKETLLMTVPALCLWPDAGPSLRLRERVLRASPFLAASGVYLALRIAVLGGARASGGSHHIATALRYLAPLELEGLWSALWPRRLYLRFLSDEMGSLGAFELSVLALVLFVILGLMWLLRRRAPVPVWGLLWFWLCLAPAALIAGMLWPGFGRFLYLPSAGLAVTMAWVARVAWARLPKWRLAQAAAAVVYLAVLGMSLRAWAEDFRGVESLYGATIAKNPKGPHAYGWLGIAYRNEGREEEAIGPLSIAHRLAPDEPRYAHHLLYALVETGRHDAAVRVAKNCVRQYKIDAAECHLLLYSTYQMTDPDFAIRQLIDCIDKDRKPARCKEAFDEALSIHPLRKRYQEIVRDTQHP